MSEKISKNALSNIFGMVIHIILAFILSPFLVHTLGDTQYGIWTVAAAFTGYMSLLDLGLTSAVNRYIAKYNSTGDSKNVNSIASTALLLFVLLGMIVILVSPFMANLVVNLINVDKSLADTIHLLIIVISFDVGIFIVAGIFTGIYGGLQKYTVINFVQVSAAIYKALMFYFFLSNEYGLVSMGIISITANLFAAGMFYLVLRKTEPKIVFKFNSFRSFNASKLFHYSKFSFLAMLANQIIYYSDAFVIGFFLSAAAVTYYSIPWTLSEYSKKLIIAISKTYSPAITEKQGQGNYKDIIDMYLSGTRYMIILSNLLSIGVIILGGAFIAIWMGPKYRELSEWVLIILFVNQYVMGPQHISYAFLKGLAKQKSYSYMSIVVSFLNLILSILLVQKWGIIGVAIGAAIPQILFHGFYVPFITLKAVKLSAWVYFKNTYLLSIIPTLILALSLIAIREYNYPDNYFELLISAAAVSLIYLSLVYFLMLNKRERLFILKKCKIIK